MKELTIEQKAQRYDEAIAKAKRMFSEKELNYIFPELKEENEDEKIRKAIITFFELQDDNTTYCLIPKKDILAWLEKQGKSIKIKKGKNYLCTKTHKYAGVEWIKGVKYYSPEDYSLINQACTYYCPKYSKEEHNSFFKEVEYDCCLEKQGEQGKSALEAIKEEKVDNANHHDICETCDRAGCIEECPVKLVEKQEPADKVEPKFHERDWVVRGNTVAQILDVQEQYYVGLDINGKDFTSSKFLNDDKIHLWTIQDAKNGDVLADKYNNIGIFSRCEGICWHSYIYLECDGELRGFSIGGRHEQIDTHPATKEQRDALMKAMADAGYTFDFEKKELKKIEQKHTPKHKVGDTIYYNSFGRLVSFTIANIVEDGTDNPMYEDKDGNSVFQNDIVEQKPADKVEPKFHEGDWLVNIEYGNVVRVLEVLKDNYRLDFGGDTIGALCTELVDNDYRLWDINKDAKDGDILVCNEEILLFKSYSVQNRISLYCWYNGQTNNFHSKEVDNVSVTTRNKICPATKEQHDALEKAMTDAGYTFDFEKKELKKIEQPHAWSEEDETNLRRTEYAVMKFFGGDCSLVDWLRKSLKDRYTWKPSDEQMEFLKKCIEAYNEVTFPTEVRVLSSLYNDLKKLREE